jgi:hypothetical protein
MEETLIHMIRDKSKSSSLKGTDVFRSTDPNSVITNIYIKKGIDAPDNITLVVGDKK